MNRKHEVPTFNSDSFNCPNCDAFAHQEWSHTSHFANGRREDLDELTISFCKKCDEYSLWLHEKMIFPSVSSAPIAVENMPKDVREIYEEAGEISTKSPRAAAALLRVSLEKLTAHLDETDGDLNTRIGKLSKKGLPQQVIQSLDIVRITGNEGGSHAGLIDLTGNDGGDIVNKLFWLVNFIVEKVITEPKSISDTFEELPEPKKAGVKQRDSK